MMRRLLLLAMGVAMVAAPMVSRGDAPEGCFAQKLAGSSPFPATCTYTATVPGNIVGAGVWTVKVWWSGTCDAGAPDWQRTTRNGDNELPGGGAWEGSIAPGSCARATADTEGTTVAIGEVRPATEPAPVPTDVPTAVPSDVPTAVPSDVPTTVPTDVPTDVPTP